MSDFEFILSEQSGAVRTLTLQRGKANALNDEVVKELMEAFKQAERDDSVRAVVLTGAGRVFCAGHDMASLAEARQPGSIRWHLQRTYNLLVPQMRNLAKPILAAINGPVAGAGLGVALAADLRIATESARFVFGFTGIGLTADCGVSLNLPLLIGYARALEVALTNEPISAEKALDYGLVSRVVPDADLQQVASGLASELAQGPTRAFALTKRLFNRAWLANMDSVLDQEAYLQEIASRTADHKEGVAAFLAKSTPQFKGI